ILAQSAPLVVLGWAASRPRALGAADEPKATGEKSAKGVDAHPVDATKTWTTAVDPKALSANVRKGLGWLAEHQLASGGWGQGEESAQMGGGTALRDTPNVADTCIAALALIRSGS